MGSKISATSSEIKDFLGYFQKLEEDVAVLSNVNKKLLQRITDNERHCWANIQYLRRECLDVVDIPSSVGDIALGDKVCQVFHENGVDVGERDIPSCRRFKKAKSQTIVKFSNRKDSLKALGKKKQLRDVEPAVLDLPQDAKFLLIRVYAPTIGASATIVKNLERGI